MRRLAVLITFALFGMLTLGAGGAHGFHEDPGEDPMVELANWDFYGKGQDCYEKMEKHILQLTQASRGTIKAYLREARQFKAWAKKCLKQLKKKPVATDNGKTGKKRLVKAFKAFKLAACKYQASARATKQGKQKKSTKRFNEATKALNKARARVTKSDNALRGMP